MKAKFENINQFANKQRKLKKKILKKKAVKTNAKEYLSENKLKKSAKFFK